MAYLYNYDYRTQDSQIKVFNLKAGKTERENFITDGTTIRTPYSISVNPYSGNVYITDAYDYKVKGDVLCFSPQGQLIFKLPNVGINSNTVLFRNKASQGNPDENPADPEAGAFANKVLEYNPAPSQYMNTSYTAYEEGFTGIQVLARATELLQDRTTCLFTLGGFGGNITVGFDHTIPNVPGEYDFKIYGNATMICMALCWINPEETPNRESCLYPKTRMATDCRMMSGTNWQEANITRLPPSATTKSLTTVPLRQTGM